MLSESLSISSSSIDRQGEHMLWGSSSSASTCGVFLEGERAGTVEREQELLDGVECRSEDIGEYCLR